MKPSLIVIQVDSVVPRDRLIRLQVAAADRPEDCVVGKAGALGNLTRRENISNHITYIRRHAYSLPEP
jgi:hypothetical protein